MLTNDSFETFKLENSSGWIIFARISILSTVRMLGLLKNEFASTAKTWLFLTAFNEFHDSLFFKISSYSVTVLCVSNPHGIKMIMSGFDLIISSMSNR